MTYNIKLTNSFTKKKELFKPIDSQNVGMYVCGPTVYDNPHVGNARTLVIFDTLFRVLKLIYGKNVKYVRNITDVDDKIIQSAKKKNISIKEVTFNVTKIFNNDGESLNYLKPKFKQRLIDKFK